MKITQADIEMADDVYGALLTEGPNIHRWTIWTLAALLISFITWSYFAALDQVTTGEGKVVPSSKTQEIQSLDGGILKELYVYDGMHVKKGQKLVLIDDVRVKSDYNQQQKELDSLRADIIRLRGELSSILVGDDNDWRFRIQITKKNITFPSDLNRDSPELVARQKQEYNGRLDSLINQISIQASRIEQKQQEIIELTSKIYIADKNYSFAKKELELTRPLAEKKIVPEIELIRIQRTANEANGALLSLRLVVPKLQSSLAEEISKRLETVLVYRTETRAELNQFQSSLSRILEAQKSTSDKVSKSLLHSPVIGTIKVVHKTTLGSVVRPAETIMEIVPTEDKLLIEAKIKPQDIAFLHPGLKAIVKVTAYDFAKYGGLTGKVEHISADTTVDDKGNSFYIIRIRTDASSLFDRNNTEMPIIPGMMTTVDIITGKRTILEYILNPVLRAKQTALRER